MRPRAIAVIKLGHVAYFTPDLAKTMEILPSGVLGFKVSTGSADYLAFMRCNPDHYTVNFLKGRQGAYAPYRLLSSRFRAP